MSIPPPTIRQLFDWAKTFDTHAAFPTHMESSCFLAQFWSSQQNRHVKVWRTASIIGTETVEHPPWLVIFMAWYDDTPVTYGQRWRGDIIRKLHELYLSFGDI